MHLSIEGGGYSVEIPSARGDCSPLGRAECELRYFGRWSPVVEWVMALLLSPV